MIKIMVLIIGIIFLNFNSCYPQGKKLYQDKFVVVLDVQQQFYANKLQESKAKEMIQNINSLLDITAPEKVIYIKSAGKMLSVTFKGVKVDTIPAPDLDSNLKIVSHNVFTKYEGDAFTSVELSRFLQGNNVREIILVGLLAEKCIYQTALGGINRGYSMYLIPEAILGMSLKSKTKAMTKMAGKGIKTLSLHEINQASF